MSAHLEPLRYGAVPREADALCVFVHGRTQSPEDMIEQAVGQLVAPGIAFVLPRAANKSWYDARAIDPLVDETRRQLAASLDYLRQTIDELQRAAGTTKPLLIGGFSQGACLVLEYAMTYGPWAGAMVNLTGCRVGVQARPVPDLASMPVYLTGSDNDPWVPVAAFADAALALGQARARLRCDLFPGRSHEISAPEVKALDALLSSLAQGQSHFKDPAA